jgi:threonine dehydrogenase-like Zn-dependent dehydrogenase
VGHAACVYSLIRRLGRVFGGSARCPGRSRWAGQRRVRRRDALGDALVWPGRVDRLVQQSADIVVDCVAIEPTMRQAVALASKGGTIVVAGVPPAEVTIPLAIVQDHQIRIQGSVTYLARTTKRASGFSTSARFAPLTS